MSAPSTPLVRSDLAIASVRPIGRVLAQRVALVVIVVLALGLGVWRLDAEGLSNTYYAATVRSMLTSWHAFFFVSFDPAGFITVDKPPLGFWLQALSAFAFGFSGISLLLPEVVATVLSVLLLYHLVARVFGAGAGLVAAFALAVTPIAVATARNNTVDSVLVLVVLLGAWAVSIAAERGQIRWLVLAFVLVGVGFNVKMLQAYLVLPAFGAAFFLAAPRSLPIRIGGLALATFALLAVSASWALAVDAIPASQRPYVGGSTSNSEIELAIDYNGIQRLDGNQGFPDTGTPGPLRLFEGSVGGQASWLVPFAFVGLGGGLLVWLRDLPFVRRRRRRGRRGRRGRGARAASAAAAASGGATLAAPDSAAASGGTTLLAPDSAAASGGTTLLAPDSAAASGGTTLAAPANPGGASPRAAVVADARRRRFAAFVLWGVWLATMLVFFSVARFWHLHYLEMMGPAVAAIVGGGAAVLAREYRRGSAIGMLLPVALVFSGLVQLAMLLVDRAWADRLLPIVLTVSLGVGAILLLMRLAPDLFAASPRRRVTGTLVAIGLAGLMVAPLVWSAVTVADAPGATLPEAGPRTNPGFALGGFGGFGGPGGGRGAPGGAPGAPPPAGAASAATPDPMVQFLEANQGSARWIVAASNAQIAAPIILASGDGVMAIGGFTGSDPAITLAQFRSMVSAGEVRYVLVTGGFGRIGGGDSGQILRWASNTCRPVSLANGGSLGSPGELGSGSSLSSIGLFGGMALVDCRGM